MDMNDERWRGRGVPVGREVVEYHWPYDGPHSPDHVVEAASALSALVRYLSNATRPGQASRTLPYAASVHGVLDGLGGAVGGVEQLLRQLIVVVRDQSAYVYDDRGDRPGSATAAQLVARLSRVHGAVLGLGRELVAALELSAHLGNRMGV